jgi:hypothetical protein
MRVKSNPRTKTNNSRVDLLFVSTWLKFQSVRGGIYISLNISTMLRNMIMP